MSKQRKSSRGGIGLMGVLFLILLVLKLLEIEPVASWSWLWVTSPLWLGWVIVFGFVLLAASAVGIGTVADKTFSGRKVRLKDDD